MNIYVSQSCTDANECNVLNGGCEHQCTNTVGSYECSCNAGFIRDSNGRNCTGKYKSLLNTLHLNSCHALASAINKLMSLIIQSVACQTLA